MTYIRLTEPPPLAFYALIADWRCTALIVYVQYRTRSVIWYHPTKPWKRMPYGTDGSRAAC